MGHNQIPFIPRSIGMLANLVEFYFRDNYLSNLPVEVGGLIRLKHLDVAFNKWKGHGHKRLAAWINYCLPIFRITA